MQFRLPFGRSFGAYASLSARDLKRLKVFRNELLILLLKAALREQRPIRELVGNRLSGSQLDKALSPKAFFVK